MIGDALVDVSARLAAPLAEGSDTPASVTWEPGGSAANLAAWLAALGVGVTFVGSVGDDLIGSVQVEDLRGRGVAAEVRSLPGQPTGAVVVLVAPGGDRSMVTSRGAAAGLLPEHLPRSLFRADVHLHLSGYLLLDHRSRAAGLAALRLGRAAGMSVSLDPSSREPLRLLGRDRFRRWVRGVDVLFPNLEEGMVLTGLDEPEAVVTDLLADCGEVVLSLGEEGALWARGRERRRLPAAPSRVLDTTGAGDAFAAGWLSAWLGGAGGGAALEPALKLAALAVSFPGGRPPPGVVVAGFRWQGAR